MAAEEGDKILTDDDYRLAVRTSQLLHDALDQMEGKDDLWKYLVPLNIVRGTSIDKILKRQEPKYQPNAQAQNITINFISQKPPDQESPDVVEGEIVKDKGSDER
jgi:hypothetical protein